MIDNATKSDKDKEFINYATFISCSKSHHVAMNFNNNYGILFCFKHCGFKVLILLNAIFQKIGEIFQNAISLLFAIKIEI